MENLLAVNEKSGDVIFKTYYPEKRRISYNDELCIKVLKRVLEDYPNTDYTKLRRSLFQILKEDSYQLQYYDGHLSDFTLMLYANICDSLEGPMNKLDFEIYLCDLMYWSKEICYSSPSSIQGYIV